MPDEPAFDIQPFSGPSWSFDMSGWPSSWLQQARRLNYAAALLRNDINRQFSDLLAWRDGGPVPPPSENVFDTYIFLGALSLENLLKGIYMRTNPNCIKDGKLRGNVMISHDLEMIAREAGIATSDQEAAFLKFCTSAIKSWGRYPLGKNMSDHSGRREVSSDVFPVYDGLYSRLAAEIEAHPAPYRMPQNQ